MPPGSTRRLASCPPPPSDRPANADAGPSTSGSTGLLELNYDGLPFVEDDFQFNPPTGYKFIETNPIISPDRKRSAICSCSRDQAASHEACTWQRKQRAPAYNGLMCSITTDLQASSACPA